MRALYNGILKAVRRPETLTPSWGLGLAFTMILITFVARPAGILFAASFQNEDFDNPSNDVFLWGLIFASIPILWFMLQSVNQSAHKTSEENRQPPPVITDSVGLVETKTRPFWIVFLFGFAVIVMLDNIALLFGSPRDSLPIGLDRLQDPSLITWAGAIVLFMISIPLIEEILFRGLFYTSFATQFKNNLRAIYISTALFVLYYFSQYFSSDLLEWRTIYGGIIFPLVLGLSAGIARAHTKSVWGGIAIHLGFNVFLLLKIYLIIAL